MRYKDFYAELGKLLYAVAGIDTVVSAIEKQRLRDIIKKELVPAEVHTDAFGTDSAYYAEMEFDFLDEQIADPEAAFESFIDFMKEHSTAFDSNLKKKVLKVVKELASADHGVNGKENMLMKRLMDELYVK